jgi:hypothetical protein
MRVDIPDRLTVTTNCRYCLTELAVPLEMFERQVAVICQQVERQCQDPGRRLEP